MGRNLAAIDERAVVAREHALEVDAYSSEVDFYHLFWIFIIMSIVGLYVETAVSYPIDGVWKNRAGLIWGPFSPIYGLGAVLMTLALHRLQHAATWRVFLVAALLGATFEYLVGSFWEMAFGFVAWDYSGHFLNIGGHTCFAMAIVWGALGTGWIKLVYPGFNKMLDIVPQSVRKPVTRVAFALLMVDVVVTFAAFDCWFLRTAGTLPDNPWAQLVSGLFPDDYMKSHFQTISCFPELVHR